LTIITDRTPCSFKQVHDPIGVRQQPVPGCGKHDASAGALKEGYPEAVLYRFQSSRDIRLNGIEFDCRLADAARAGHGCKQSKVGSIHASLFL